MTLFYLSLLHWIVLCVHMEYFMTYQNASIVFWRITRFTLIEDFFYYIRDGKCPVTANLWCTSSSVVRPVQSSPAFEFHRRFVQPLTGTHCTKECPRAFGRVLASEYTYVYFRLQIRLARTSVQPGLNKNSNIRHPGVQFDPFKNLVSEAANPVPNSIESNSIKPAVSSGGETHFSLRGQHRSQHTAGTYEVRSHSQETAPSVVHCSSH